ncbi:MAG: outer-membrane lipoprotein carrier protein LolA [Bacteroidaceae bacterium]|nr:outer-membrane lipoprotein carrier protein LolA [Bacteroidaceae bacterium]
MKRIGILMVALVLGLSSMTAQEATKILDKTAATLKAAKNVKIGFTLEADGGGNTAGNTGYIKLSGQKFVVNMGGSITWFDGKTMWSYVKKNEEVNVTTPTAAEVAKMNPYAFLSFYKKGYTAKMGKSTAKEHEVVLTGSEGSAYEQVVMRVNKATNEPTYLKTTSAKGVVTVIRCNSLVKNQKYTDATFRFNKKNYPKAEVVDLR